ncbi:MAG TPA: GyrI-like domain-containing protein [Gemmataceae bacterium]|nr:GyrI-like domain-containing protein [Gemmataceae bacterium]
MEYEIRLEQFASRPIAVLRRRASLPELGKIIPDACGLVWNVVRALKIVGAGRHVALYWDDVFNLEIGVELDGPFAGHGEVIASALPGGTVATAVHLGPYQQLPAAHQAIREWCQQHGHTLAGPSWEIYDHWKHEWCDDPTKIRTDVFYLLKLDA